MSLLKANSSTQPKVKVSSLAFLSLEKNIHIMFLLEEIAHRLCVCVCTYFGAWGRSVFIGLCMCICVYDVSVCVYFG